MKYLLFIPVYNCEMQITRVLNSIKIEGVDKVFDEIIIVDNQSTDNTIEAVRKCSIENGLSVTLLQNEINYNLGGSHKIAFEYMQDNNFDYILIFHGDDQAEVNDIRKFIDASLSRKYDKIMGSRFMKKSKVEGYSIVRKYGNLIMNVFTSIITFHVIKDLGSGLNMYSLSFIKSSFYKNCSDNLTFNNHLLFCDPVMTQKSVYLPINWNERDQVSNAKLLAQSTEIILLACKRGLKLLMGENILHGDLCGHSKHAYKEIESK